MPGPGPPAGRPGPPRRPQGPPRREWDLFRIRLPLIAAGAGTDQAVELARAHPEGDTSYAAGDIATLLADAGRTGETVAVLEQHPSANRRALAGYLIDLGRIDDAVAVLPRRDPRPAVAWGDPWCSEFPS
ncbi:hypothetical protein ACFU7Y_42730 [Kitasatospora sp. NPDC057542]|uniref:hypothetical protein n=1 Tax=Kitasatospora sp. NPDC057542 TaxID=3346162 RepID=UPI003688A985